MDDKDKKNKKQQEEQSKESVISNESEKSQSKNNEENIENAGVAQEEFDALKDLAGKLEDQYKRAVADYQNLVRRTQEEKREWARFSSKELVLKLLPILDTLMLAEKHTQDKSFTLAVGQFLQVLRDEGVGRIETVGKEFDPILMECVTTQEGEQNKVLEELRAGYIMGDQVLRSAQVTVGK